MAEPAGTRAFTQAQERAEAMLGKLSPRERQVADLVTEGLSDREISCMLTISQRTAESHVAHILTKLDFSSRLQVAICVAKSAAD
jgi:DNA-binding NarL/FixJ family response regulator